MCSEILRVFQSEHPLSGVTGKARADARGGDCRVFPCRLCSASRGSHHPELCLGARGTGRLLRPGPSPSALTHVSSHPSSAVSLAFWNTALTMSLFPTEALSLQNPGRAPGPAIPSRSHSLHSRFSRVSVRQTQHVLLPGGLPFSWWLLFLMCIRITWGWDEKYSLPDLTPVGRAEAPGSELLPSASLR